MSGPIPLLASTTWPYRILRVAILVALGWVLAKAVILPGHAQSPLTDEWTNTDFELRNIELQEITRGGPPKDGIPPIDAPRFVSTADAANWLAPKEPVVTLEHDGEARAYPLQILIYHEIVNDRIADTPVTVTFCPLCYSAIVFDRRVDGTILDFGTTGNVRNSDLVMYDRQSESWWQQLTGTGIVGKFAGVILERLPSVITSFEAFRSAFPNGRVLSKQTGARRSYGNNPYHRYDDINGSPFLLNAPPDTRLPPMERVLALDIGNRQRIYPFAILRRQPVINDRLNSQAITVFSKADVLSAVDAAVIRYSQKTLMAAAFSRILNGNTLTFRQEGDRIIDTGTGSAWSIFGKATSGPLAGQALTPIDSGVHFAFAWLAFYPEADIYQADTDTPAP